MPEQQLQSSYSEEFLEGYTKAKNEDKEELSRTLEKLHNLEREYVDLKTTAIKDAQFVKENNEYAELGKSVITLLKYFRGNINE